MSEGRPRNTAASLSESGTPTLTPHPPNTPLPTPRLEAEVEAAKCRGRLEQSEVGRSRRPVALSAPFTPSHVEPHRRQLPHFSDNSTKLAARTSFLSKVATWSPPKPTHDMRGWRRPSDAAGE